MGKIIQIKMEINEIEDKKERENMNINKVKKIVLIFEKTNKIL